MREATLCFLWSRMCVRCGLDPALTLAAVLLAPSPTPHSYPLAPARCVVKEGDTKSRVKMCHMFFEDFLVRLATALQP